MKYHTIKSDLWEDEKVIGLDVNQKLLFVYLSTNHRCPPSGIYKLSLQTIAFELNIPIQDIKDAIKNLSKQNLASFDGVRNSFWIQGKIKHNRIDFKNYVAVKSISNDLDNFKGASWYGAFFDKYPEFIDIAIKLEDMKKVRYHRLDCLLFFVLCVLSFVNGGTLGARWGHMGVTWGA